MRDHGMPVAATLEFLNHYPFAEERKIIGEKMSIKSQAGWE